MPIDELPRRFYEMEAIPGIIEMERVEKINEIINQVNFLSETMEYKKSQIDYVIEDLERAVSRLKHVRDKQCQ